MSTRYTALRSIPSPDGEGEIAKGKPVPVDVPDGYIRIWERKGWIEESGNVKSSKRTDRQIKNADLENREG